MAKNSKKRAILAVFRPFLAKKCDFLVKTSTISTKFLYKIRKKK